MGDCDKPTKGGLFTFETSHPTLGVLGVSFGQPERIAVEECTKASKLKFKQISSTKGDGKIHQTFLCQLARHSGTKVGTTVRGFAFSGVVFFKA